MFRKSLPLALLATLALYSCNKDGDFKTTKSGLQYKIVTDAKGENAEVGDVLMAHLVVRTADTVLNDSRKEGNNMAIEIPLFSNDYNGDWWEGLAMLSKGDSAVFRSPVDSLLVAHPEAAAQVSFLKKGGYIQYEIKVDSIKKDPMMKQQIMQMLQQRDLQKQAGKAGGNNEAMPQEQAPQTDPAVQAATDDKVIQDYLASNKMQAKKTASGLYYIIEKAGSGPALQTGQTVSVNYTGKTLDGQIFDSSEGKSPFSFPLGKGQVIPGWDEGVALAKKGTKMKLFIPSSLAYGPSGSGPAIGPNSVLMFDVEVLDAK